ncbi:helix-turn-helix domain-containing protein [Geoalkalibacter ferrihydriticus]|uniref:helix-turn-helix domain-containing protein n=1 Tax=Geoalkalibacter ferrihydriticus TaxID=392333 RepID=UPI00190F10F0
MLTREERYQIYALNAAGQNQSEIAQIIGHHKSTVSRELRRNPGHRGYPRRRTLLPSSAVEGKASNFIAGLGSG